ncbi:hypothetical protein JCM14469_30020 [Desulfatiferula olefinivorans]
MVNNKSGAACVDRQGVIVGLWTERDLMRNLLTKGFDIHTARVGDHMTTDFHTVPHTEGLIEMQDQCAGRCTRHLFVEKEGRIIGLLSTDDLMIANLNAKSDEVSDLKRYVSLEYYENWRWKKPTDPAL